jgi:hypothetical protein
MRQAHFMRGQKQTPQQALPSDVRLAILALQAQFVFTRATAVQAAQLSDAVQSAVSVSRDSSATFSVNQPVSLPKVRLL